MQGEAFSVEFSNGLAEAMRPHLDGLDAKIDRLSHGLSQIDDGLRDIIFNHLAEIGLDDINMKDRYEL